MQPHPTAAPGRRFSVRDLVAVPTRAQALWIVGGQLLVGIAVGFAWLVAAPKTVSYVVPDASGAALIIPAQRENWIAGDGRFALFTVVAGVVAAVLVWFLGRFRNLRGASALGLLLVGGLAASLAARTTGELFSGGHESGALRTAITPPLNLHAQTLLMLWAFSAVLVYTMIAGLSSDDALGLPVRVPQAVTDPSADPGDGDGSAGPEAGSESVGADRNGMQR